MMNKKEKAAYDEAIKAVFVARALNWSEHVQPDIRPPDNSTQLAVGYLYGGSRVEIACTTGVNHAFGRQDKTTSQGARWLYSTRLLALKAMRYAMELDFAKKLAEVDIEIEQEKAA